MLHQLLATGLARTETGMRHAARRIGTNLRHRREYRLLLSQPDDVIADAGLTRSQVIAAARRPLF